MIAAMPVLCRKRLNRQAEIMTHIFPNVTGSLAPKRSSIFPAAGGKACADDAARKEQAACCKRVFTHYELSIVRNEETRAEAYELD